MSNVLSFFRVSLLTSPSSLHSTAYTVSATIKNNGTVAGHEVKMDWTRPVIIYSLSIVTFADSTALHIPSRVRRVPSLLAEGIR